MKSAGAGKLKYTKTEPPLKTATPRKTHDQILVAVDPGEVHVGVAVFGHDIKGWECLWVCEMTPVEFEDWYSAHSIHGEIDITVVEEWRLIPETASTQYGSDMPTSQLIGAIKYIHRNTHHIPERDFGRDVAPILVFQSPKIKKPVRAMLRARGIVSVAKVMKVTGDHVLDAELHGYYYIIKTLGEETHTTTATRSKKNNQEMTSPYHWKDLSPWL